MGIEIKIAKGWTGTVYIRADGSIDPSDAPIITFDNLTYTLIDDIVTLDDGIIVERNNITIIGEGHSLKGSNAGIGIRIFSLSNVKVESMNISNFGSGIVIHSSTNVKIMNNSISLCLNGIVIVSSNYNQICGNTITGVFFGIDMQGSSENVISENQVSIGEIGLWMRSSSKNIIIDNYFVKSKRGLVVSTTSNYNNISKNTFVDNVNSGLCLEDYSSFNVICFNNFERDGIIVSSSFNNMINNNTINGKPIIYLENVENVTIKNESVGQVIVVNCRNVKIVEITIENACVGVELCESSYCEVVGSNLTNNVYGVLVNRYSDGNIIQKNLFTNNKVGIRLDAWGTTTVNTVINNLLEGNKRGIEIVSLCYVLQNDIRNNELGVWIEHSSFTLYHNNFIDNWIQAKYNAHIFGPYRFYADNGYPCGGNYWSDYNCPDLYYGPNQNLTGADGIGDVPKGLSPDPEYYPVTVFDRYPLLSPLELFTINWDGKTYNAKIISNSSLSGFNFDLTQKELSFMIEGLERTKGFCRVVLPNVIVKELWHSNYCVLLDGIPWSFKNWTDENNTYIYFDYTHADYQIIAIVPEFSNISLPVITAISSIVVLLVIKRKKVNIRPNFHENKCQKNSPKILNFDGNKK